MSSRGSRRNGMDVRCERCGVVLGTKHMDDCRESYRVVVYGDGDEVLYDRTFLSTNELFYAGLPGIARRVMGLVKQVSGV